MVSVSRASISLASRARFQVNDVLHQLDSNDEWVAEGSDDLVMDSDYDYDSASSEEGTRSVHIHACSIIVIKM